LVGTTGMVVGGAGVWATVVRQVDARKANATAA